MSKSSSLVITISCSVEGCDVQDVQVGSEYIPRDGWSELTLDGEPYDLCPEHCKWFAHFIHGSAEEMTPDIGDPRTDWDGPRVKDECL